ncbi:MAG TPA: hypothetical protein PK364_10085 [Synergistaceae bacterium]|nr:hypothetical protein [Synergistaceae bacterium]
MPRMKGSKKNQDNRKKSEHAPSSESKFDDSLWKDMLTAFFLPMLRSALPEMAQMVDTNRSVAFLDKELRRLARYTRKYTEGEPDGGRFVDILADVPLVTGESAWILLHAEVQGRGGRENFPLRMHRYRCLLEGRYNRSVMGLALLTQPIGKEQEKGLYLWEKFGAKVLYEYPVFKIYEGDEESLQKSDNPFDLAHYAGIQAWKHRRQDARKLIYMKTMLHILNERGWSRDEKLWLLWFIEGITHIKDPQVWQEWEQELEQQKEEGNMYISLMERKGMQKGIQEGMQKGIQEGMQKGIQEGRREERITLAVSMFRERIPLPTIAKITGFSEEEIREFARQEAN